MKPNIKGLHHDHIDGSRALVGVISRLYEMQGLKFPFASAEAWVAYFRDPHADIVKKFASSTDGMQTRETLEHAGYAYGKFRAAEGYEYVEAKFAPAYHARGGLTIAEAADSMILGLQRAADETGITIMPQLCINREADVETGIAVARAALDYDGAAALDLACDEAGHPPEKHLAAYKLTFGTRVRRDCHAGEFVAREPARTYRARLLRNVRTAIKKLRCDGIGHAIPLADDPELVREVVDKGIRVAGCPLSNLVCGLIVSVRELKIDALLDAGVIYTLNADDDLFLPPMEMVATFCDLAYAFTPEQARKLEENVFAGAFKKPRSQK